MNTIILSNPNRYATRKLLTKEFNDKDLRFFKVEGDIYVVPESLEVREHTFIFEHSLIKLSKNINNLKLFEEVA